MLSDSYKILNVSPCYVSCVFRILQNRRLMYIHDMAYVVDVNECKTMVAFEVPR